MNSTAFKNKIYNNFEEFHDKSLNICSLCKDEYTHSYLLHKLVVCKVLKSLKKIRRENIIKRNYYKSRTCSY